MTTTPTELDWIEAPAEIIGRTLARLIDLLLVVLLSEVVRVVLPQSLWAWSPSPFERLYLLRDSWSVYFRGDIRALPYYVSFALPCGFLYETAFTVSRYRATPGKILFGYRLKTQEGKRLAWFQAVGRALLQMPALLIVYVPGYFYPPACLFYGFWAAHPRMRTPPDLLVGSMVVKRVPRPPIANSEQVAAMF